MALWFGVGASESSGCGTLEEMARAIPVVCFSSWRGNGSREEPSVHTGDGRAAAHLDHTCGVDPGVLQGLEAGPSKLIVADAADHAGVHPKKAKGDGFVGALPTWAPAAVSSAVVAAARCRP